MRVFGNVQLRFSPFSTAGARTGGKGNKGRGKHSAAEPVLANHRDDGAGKDPLVRGFCGIVIIDRTAGRVLAVDGVARGAVGAVCHGRVDTPS